MAKVNIKDLGVDELSRRVMEDERSYHRVASMTTTKEIKQFVKKNYKASQEQLDELIMDFKH
jgi:hypothetical protein